ncbi:MAG: ParA family protein [Phycisphaeraceae bacterium]|nr:ParA family protein [Phycisphaeraceae bacterium]
MPPHPARVIALINQKGGVGKTTTTVNLGAAIAEEPSETGPRRVLIIDMDPQSHASLHLGVEPGNGKASVYDLLSDSTIDPADALHEARPNLFVLPAETDLAAAESELAAKPDRLQRLRQAIDKIQAGPRPFDFILIDCPPALGLLTLNALAAAREVFIPMQAHFLALQGVGKLLETVARVSQSVNPRLVVTGVILCMHDPQSTHSREVVADLEGFFEAARGQPVAWRAARVYRPPVRRNIKLAECPSFGQTIFDYSAWCPGANDYRQLGHAIVSEWERITARIAPGQGAAAAAPAVTEAKPTVTTVPPRPPAVAGERSA